MNEYLQGQTIEAIACIWQEEYSGKITENSTVEKFASNWQMLYRSQYLYPKYTFLLSGVPQGVPCPISKWLGMIYTQYTQGDALKQSD